MKTDGSSTPQTLPISGKHPRSKDDSSQVGKKMKGTCVCPVGDEAIKGEDRLQRDVENVLSVIPSTDKPIDANAIKDCYHLEKYNSQSNHHRPLLVRLLRSTDTSNILRNKSKLTSVIKFDSPIFIKPDLTPEEGSKESQLLK